MTEQTDSSQDTSKKPREYSRDQQLGLIFAATVLFVSFALYVYNLSTLVTTKQTQPSQVTEITTSHSGSQLDSTTTKETQPTQSTETTTSRSYDST